MQTHKITEAEYRKRSENKLEHLAAIAVAVAVAVDAGTVVVVVVVVVCFCMLLVLRSNLFS